MTTHPKRRHPQRKCRPRRKTAIGSLIEAARARLGHNRSEAARAIGCVPSSLANWEDSGLRPLTAHCPGIASYLGLPAAEIERMRGRLRKGAK